MILFALTRRQFATFWRKPCGYCGDAIGSIGLDRVNNDGGYVMGNVLPCCAKCNQMKSSLDAVDFIARCARITYRLRSVDNLLPSGPISSESQPLRKQ